MNGRGPPCGGGRGPLTGNGPGLGNPCWGGGLSCGVVVPAGGLHFVGSGGIDFTPPSGHCLSPAYPQEKPTWMERAWTAGLEAGWSIPGIAVPASRSSPFPASEISAPIQVSSHPLRVEGSPRLGRVVLVTRPLSGVVEAAGPQL